ncbi:MAG: hypothetical protein FRX49_01849 [Trebouxia sp. A1-2]|nr:MAG: hypothetical protein FRX49_01849 [Trebouxia sp. A1-2]
MEEYCAVCAEPIQFTAYGPCGHKDACSKCIVRLRVVLEDKRCVICQQEHDSVFVTKNLGEFTPTLPATAFADLQVVGRELQGELKRLRDANAYFEDEEHFEYLRQALLGCAAAADRPNAALLAHSTALYRQLCSFTHPDLAEVPDDVPQQYRGLKALKDALRTHLQRYFCDVCLEGRKVFLSEQVLYSKQQLNSHKQHGDREGPLAESGFTGHCHCKFCHKWFYGENELWKHMSEKHESCFVCKRSNPDRHVYYKDYAELEEHFRHEHYLCEDTICRQERFQVWSTEAELHQHRVKVHGDHMSRHEKRLAMRIPLDINFRRGEDVQSSGAAGPSGTTIGGAGGVRSRFRLREPNHRQDQSQIASAIQASMDSANAEAALRDNRQQALAQLVCLHIHTSFIDNTDPYSSCIRSSFIGDASERQSFNLLKIFPSVFWRAWVFSGSMSGAVGSCWGVPWVAASLLEDFPALPGTSKSAKRRAKEKNRSLAQRVGTQGEVRVINRGEPPQPSSRDAPQPSSINRPVSGAVDMTAAAESSATEETASDASYSADELPEEHATVALHHNRGSMPSISPSGQEAFPPLPQAAPAARQPPPSGLQARPFINPLAAKAPAKGKVSKAPAAKVGPQTAPKIEEFPALGGAPGGSRRLPPSAAGASGMGGAASGDGTAAPTGVSDALKAANKAVIDKVRQRVSPEDFSQFKQQSGSFMRGDASAKDFHTQVVTLGLAALLPELAALCPDPLKRSDLLAVHRSTFVAESAAKAGGGWVPPEAAAAAADHATRFSSWTCPSCTLINAPQAFSCEACRSMRPPSNSAAQEDGIAASSSNSAQTNGNSSQGEDKGKKKGKAPKFERLRLTGGDALATQNWLDTAGGQRSKPQNVWTQKQPERPSQWVNGKLTQKDRAVKDAWAKK